MKVIRATRRGKIKVERWAGLWAPGQKQRRSSWEVGGGSGVGERSLRRERSAMSHSADGQSITEDQELGIGLASEAAADLSRALEWRGEGRPDRSGFRSQQQERALWKDRNFCEGFC